MTAPHYADESVTVWHGDALDVLAGMPDSSVDAVVTDPPYGLEFMGKDWDRFKAGRAAAYAKGGDLNLEAIAAQSGKGGVGPVYVSRPAKRCGNCGKQAWSGSPCQCAEPVWVLDNSPLFSFQQWCERWATECLRVLKPGGHLLAFGGTRTWHRLACAIEDAGFEVRDSIAWLYGSGFPKSLDVSKAIDRAAGAERAVVASYARKGRSGGILGTETDIIRDLTAPATPAAQRWQGWGTSLKPAFEPVVVARKPLAGTVAGNVLAWGTGALNVDGCRVGSGDGVVTFDRAPRAEDGGIYDLGTVTGVRPSGLGRWPTNVVLDGDAADELDRQSGTLISGANPTRRGADGRRDAYGDFAGQDECAAPRGVDVGGASRFFPTFRYEPKAPTVERPRDGDAAHPTVKPLDLMRWLVRLVTPPGGLVLDPFAGTGTTGEACIIEGARCVLIEREAAYLPLIVARLAKPIQPDLFGLGS